MTNIVYPEIINAEQKAELILLCEHASNHIPEDLNGLGLGASLLEKHIAYDIGAGMITRRMAEMMQVPAVIAQASRLLIDCNRELGHPTLIPPMSDDIVITGNQNLSTIDRQSRIDRFFTPFHAGADRLIEGHLQDGKLPYIVGMHSFTPTMGAERPWHVGIMWNEDMRLAQALIGMIERETDLVIGHNLPYSGKDLFHTMNYHAGRRGLPHVVIEVRQDLTATRTHQEEWAVLFANIFDELIARDDIRKINGV